ncbi:MAG: hypothetical protein SNJ79_14630, partial [Sphingomonadaceae bacterium]
MRMDLEPLVAEAHAEALQMESGETPAEQLARSRRRLRRRALADGILLLGAVLLAPLPFAESAHAILAVIAAAGAAIVIFLARRDADL